MKLTAVIFFLFGGLNLSCKSASEARNQSEFTSVNKSKNLEKSEFRISGSIQGVNSMEFSSYFKSTSKLPGCWNFDLEKIRAPKTKTVDTLVSSDHKEYSVRVFTGKTGICGYAWDLSQPAASLDFSTNDGLPASISIKRPTNGSVATNFKVVCKKTQSFGADALSCSVNGAPYAVNAQIEVDINQLDTGSLDIKLDLAVE